MPSRERGIQRFRAGGTFITDIVESKAAARACQSSRTWSGGHRIIAVLETPRCDTLFVQQQPDTTVARLED